MNPLKQLADLGQSIWLDSISRRLIDSGELARLVRDDGIAGVTSNPSIFEKAIGEGVEYRPAIQDLLARTPGASAMEIYERLAIRDVQDAADVLRPTFDRAYDRERGRDGFVSLEVTLKEGEDRASILREARHLWQAVGRPNVMIKVPGTGEGIAAFEALTGEGVNVNVTLLFSRETYARVAEAYLAGLETLAARDGDLARVASVASFFVSRIDTAVDKLLEGLLSRAARASERFLLRALLGKAAIANARLAYARYEEIFSGPRWQALAARGARAQRVLWASTSAKNKRYRDVLYVEELIGENTVNTAPAATIDAFREHGLPRVSLREDLDAARDAMDALEELGISMEDVTGRLLDEGLKLFGDAFEKLLATIETERRAARFATQTSA